MIEVKNLSVQTSKGVVLLDHVEFTLTPRCLYWIDRCQRLRQNHPLKGADGGIGWGCIH